jgi:hypothetical protein
MAITREEARAELARRELERRGIGAFHDGNESYNESFVEKLPRNIASGFASAGHSTLNLPYDFVKSLEKLGQDTSSGVNKYFPAPKQTFENNDPIRSFIKENNVPKELINENYGKAASNIIPNQKEYDFAQELGQKGAGTLSDRLIQGIAEYLPALAGGRSLIRTLPITKKYASIPLQKTAKLIKERGIGSGISIDNKLIDSSRRFLPKTENVKDLIKKAKSGNYEALFSLQSDLAKAQRGLSKSLTYAERLQAAPVGDLRDKIVTAIKSHYKKIGHEDISEGITRGQNKYRQYKNISENIYPIIKKAGLPVTAVGAGFYGYDRLKHLLS